uniref:LIM zinc-binding domain-containing protein n=1 Tax=Astatotilapia calliptera TaxID=8154 RepID=A0A3P8PHA0_ASTCA
KPKHSICTALLLDRFFLLAAGRVWHNPCLRCSQCQCELQTHPSLYWRDGNIYCQQDYCRSARSRLPLLPVFHLSDSGVLSPPAQDVWRRSVCSLLPANPSF